MQNEKELLSSSKRVAAPEEFRGNFFNFSARGGRGRGADFCTGNSKVSRASFYEGIARRSFRLGSLGNRRPIFGLSE